MLEDICYNIDCLTEIEQISFRSVLSNLCTNVFLIINEHLINKVCAC